MAPLDDPGLSSRLQESITECGSFDRIVIISFELETMSHFPLFRRILDEFGPEKCEVIRCISVCEDFFLETMTVEPAELSRLNAGVLTRLQSAKQLHIETPSGTMLDVELDSTKYTWISNRGRARPGGFVILPPGEVATFPAHVEGVLVAESALNTNFYTRIDPRLAAHPVTAVFRRDKLEDLSCDEASIQRVLNICRTFPFFNRVGEVGFGTNVGIRKLSPLNSHINERLPGIHLGLGQHNQTRNVVPDDCEVHLDLISAGALVWVDGEIDPSLDFSRLVPSDNEHPLTNDEDIDGDCCGVRDSFCIRPDGVLQPVKAGKR
jgi:hypothetical protein